MALKSNSPIQLSVIVPVYNNSTTLIKLHQQVREVLNTEQISFELLFVDDAGLDNSLDILSNMVDRYPEVSLVSMAHNVGQHAAVLHGLRFARGDCCAIMDADLQDPPEALVRLWRARSPNHQAVFAGRRGHYQNRSRMLTSRCYKKLIAYLTGLPKNAGIFVLLEQPLVNALLAMRVQVPWINIMIGLSGLPVYSVPVERNSRDQGLSAYSAWGRLRSAIKGLYCILTYHLWQPEKAYLENLKEDPVNYFKTRGSGRE